MPGPQQAYDDVPYTSYPYRETHPRKLRGVGTLLGMTPADTQHCRVLELGCAGGGNLVPIGEQLPAARLVGIDFSAVQIQQAKEFAAGAGVKNVEFLQASIADLGKDLGEFDYLIAHGLFSWVTPELRTHIFRLCQELLAPQGIAFVSFNTLPGWHDRAWMREAMLFHAATVEDPRRKVSAGKEFLRLLAASPFAKPYHAAMLKEQLSKVDGRDDDYLIHEYFEEDNHPLYFHEFMTIAARHGLQYLADGRVNGTPAEETLGPAKTLLDSAGPDLLRREQYGDFLRNRSFRRAILCRDDVQLDRAAAPAKARDMWVSGQLKIAGQAPDGTTFANPQGASYRVKDPGLIRELQKVISAWPAPTRLDEGAADDVVKMWEIGLVDLYADRQPGMVTNPERPQASGVARWLAGRGRVVTNTRHEAVMIDDEKRRVLAACDGKRNLPEIAQAAGTTEGKTKEIVETLGRLGLLANENSVESGPEQQ